MLEFNYDNYLNQQLELKFQEEEMNMPVSSCCDVTVTDYEQDGKEYVCDKCGEYCEVISHGEYEYNRYEDAMCDKADSERDLERCR